MGYRFRFETLLSYRRDLEEQEQLRLAHELEALEGHRDRLDSLKTQRKRLIEEFEERKKEKIAAPMFSFYMEAIARKEREIVFQTASIAAQEQIVAQVRNELAERMKDRKVMEKAREKDFQKYLYEILKKEEKESDEQAVLRHGRELLLG